MNQVDREAIIRFAAVSRLRKAAQAFLDVETEVARTSYQDHHPGVEGPPHWSDDIWRAADPVSSKLAIELRRALKEVARCFAKSDVNR
jgi:hypothetical protein